MDLIFGARLLEPPGFHATGLQNLGSEKVVSISRAKGFGMGLFTPTVNPRLKGGVKGMVNPLPLLLELGQPDKSGNLRRNYIPICPVDIPTP